jgi:hypothetical protein
MPWVNSEADLIAIFEHDLDRGQRGFNAIERKTPDRK